MRVSVVCTKVEVIIRQPYTLNWKFPHNGSHGNIEMATPWDEAHNGPDKNYPETAPPKLRNTPNIRLPQCKTRGIKATCCKTDCIVHSIITDMFCYWFRLKCNREFVYFVVYLQTFVYLIV